MISLLLLVVLVSCDTSDVGETTPATETAPAATTTPATTLSYYPPAVNYNYGRDHELTYPAKAVYSFYRYDELVAFLKEEKNTEKTAEEWGENWANYLDYVKEVNTPSENGTPLYIPYIYSYREPAKLHPFRTAGGGYHGIHLISSGFEGYPPYVEYSIDVGGEEPLFIRCLCLSQKDFARVDVQSTVDALRSFDSSIPDLDDYESDPYSYLQYEYFFEETIQFSGKSVSAVYARWVNGPDELHIAFDKTLVTITGPAEYLINRNFIASISLQKAEFP